MNYLNVLALDGAPYHWRATVLCSSFVTQREPVPAQEPEAMMSRLRDCRDVLGDDGLLCTVTWCSSSENSSTSTPGMSYDAERKDDAYENLIDTAARQGARGAPKLNTPGKHRLSGAVSRVIH